MQKLLIFGGFGFVGKNLLINLNEYYDITVLSRHTVSDDAGLFNKIKYIRFDLLKGSDIELMQIIQDIQPRYIINLISIVTADRDLGLYRSMIESNVHSLSRIFNASKDLRSLKFVLHFGSGEEYGNIAIPFREDQREYPNSPYSLTKQMATNTAIMLNRNYGYPVSVVRPSNVFGKFQNDNKFIPYVVRKLLKNEPISTTLCLQKRDFIDANTLSEFVRLLIEHNDKCVGEIVNVSSGLSVSLKEIILFCKEYCKSTSIIKFGEIPYRENEIMNFVLDNNKMKNILDINVDYDLFAKLSDYIELLRG